jgi:NAD-dependent SIR2 family protein deacetylase
MIEKCCHCKEEIKGVKKVKVWKGELLPMCYSCWAKWINGGRK